MISELFLNVNVIAPFVATVTISVTGDLKDRLPSAFRIVKAG